MKQTSAFSSLTIAMLAMGSAFAQTPRHQDGAAPSYLHPIASPQDQMTLSATAAVDLTMDVLSVTLAVVREGVEAATVQAQLKQIIENALAEARREARPPQLEVQSGMFSLQPRYAPPSARPGVTAPGIVGWQGRAEIVLEGRDLQAVAQLAGRLQGLSVARVGFTLSREARERAEAEATAQAIARFRSRAQSYASQFGFSGYRLREVQVGMEEAARFVQARAPMLRAAAVQGAGDDPLPFEAGRTSISATVSGSVQMTR
jgi:predicted secreted protein